MSLQSNLITLLTTILLFSTDTRPKILIDMQAAPLWDTKKCQFVGILTVTDFIDVLRYYRETGADVITLASRSIGDILADEDILSTVL